jgi:mannose-6-phosphate isomerase-like protein (cupin superfamily)
MDIKTTIKVINQADIQAKPGVTEGQTLKQLVGNADVPTDRIRVAFATYQPGTIEKLHWHPIEALYFIHTGSAIVRDIEGNEYNVGPGTVIYAPPGLAGSHEWEVKESLTLLAVRASTDVTKKFQFTVDKETKRSYIDADELARRGGISFESHY